MENEGYMVEAVNGKSSMNSIRAFYERNIWKLLMWNTHKEICEIDLKSLWENLRGILGRRGYKVSRINMPQVKAYLLESGEYRRIGRIVDKLANTQKNVVEEYGKWYSTESAIGVIVRSPGKENDYKIFLNKSRWNKNSKSTSPEKAFLLWLRLQLYHELLHIWEHLLLVKPAGSLTRQVMKEVDSNRFLDKSYCY